jgi:hypothetical protein
MPAAHARRSVCLRFERKMKNHIDTMLAFIGFVVLILNGGAQGSIAPITPGALEVSRMASFTLSWTFAQSLSLNKGIFLMLL